MLKKSKALYQTKLIIDCLPEGEYKSIPKEIIEYIENNYEYDDKITINPEIPLEEQNIDETTYKILNEILEQTAKQDTISTKENLEEPEKVKMKRLIEMLKKENEKIPQIKELVEEYKEALKQKDEEIIKLKESNKILNNAIQKIPVFIRRLFIKDKNIKLLTDGKN